MIVKDLLPLRIVEKTGFRCFISGFDKLYTLPSRATLRDQLIPEMYNQVQGEQKNTVHSIPSTIEITEFFCQSGFA